MHGKQGYTISAGTGISIELADNSANGFIYDEKIYARSEDIVDLKISGDNTSVTGYTFDGYKASAGTLTKNNDKYSLTMPCEDVKISA